MNISIICATATGLQKYLKDFDTHFGGLNPEDSSYAYGYRYGGASGRENSHGFEMTGVRITDTDANQRKPMETTSTATNKRLDRPVTRERRSIRAPRGDASSVSSHESRQMIIRKDMTWTVISENQ
jgi:hypothetical protein